MLSKNPLEIPMDRKLKANEIADALRLSIIAELDAINLYLQLSKSVEDENVKKVFEDVAKEEKTHVGEFLALLNSLDAEQKSELEAGLKEVKELTSMNIKDDPSNLVSNEEKKEENKVKNSNGDFLSIVVNEYQKALEEMRIFRKYLPIKRIEKGTQAIFVEKSDEKGEREIIPLNEIESYFIVSQMSIDSIDKNGELEAPDLYRSALELSNNEDRLILETILNREGTIKLPVDEWNEPSQSVNDIANAFTEILRSGATKPFALFISPKKYVKLLAISDKTGTTDLERIKAFIDNIVILPILPDNVTIIVSLQPRILELVIGIDSEIRYLGPEKGYHNFRAREKLALKVKDARGIAILEGK
ncbi:encapsulin [Fervidicoccus fontis]|uniref:Linocin_M18 bacteriocin protein n=1 Tax=Fervidicoccus fontis (strain DSM 19380 / JCM 18336 / VKM B-2539 / Kam940) TaxID=1163730 RepID=I0A2D2_FERFK|nr:family 1 encapsulin nanocompartment shell protein [Fervidicoccus fontis]AFH43139.1 Linocin_M18 bacteriocin protein [Fervidicoccus fontis Kam940]